MFSLQQKDVSLLQTEINQSHWLLHLCCKHPELRWRFDQWSHTTIPENKVIRWQSDIWVSHEQNSLRLLTSYTLVDRYQHVEGWGPSIFRNFHPIHRHITVLQNVSLYPPNDGASHVNFQDNKLLSHYLIHLTFNKQRGQCHPITSTSFPSQWEYTVLTSEQWDEWIEQCSSHSRKLTFRRPYA